MKNWREGCSPETNMEPKNWWVCRCFSFSKGGISGSTLVFRGCINRILSRKRFWELFFFIFRGHLPKKGIAKMVFFHFCWSNSATPDNSSKNLQTIIEKYIGNSFVHYGRFISKSRTKWTRCPRIQNTYC